MFQASGFPSAEAVVSSSTTKHSHLGFDSRLNPSLSCMERQRSRPYAPLTCVRCRFHPTQTLPAQPPGHAPRYASAVSSPEPSASPRRHNPLNHQPPLLSNIQLRSDSAVVPFDLTRSMVRTRALTAFSPRESPQLRWSNTKLKVLDTKLVEKPSLRGYYIGIELSSARN